MEIFIGNYSKAGYNYTDTNLEWLVSSSSSSDSLPMPTAGSDSIAGGSSKSLHHNHVSVCGDHILILFDDEYGVVNF